MKQRTACMLTLVAGLAIWPAAGVAASDDSATALPFQVALPAGFQVVRSNGPDFTVYYFNKGDVTYAGAYLGGFPSYKGKRSGAALDQTVDCVGSAPPHREILLTLPGSYTEYIHAWTASATADQQPTAEAILRSIHVDGKNSGLGGASLLNCPA